MELLPASRSTDPATGRLPQDLADAAACRTAVLEHRPDWVLNGGAPRETREEAVPGGSYQSKRQGKA